MRLARESDRDHAGGLAAVVVVQMLPACVQSALGAPGDRDYARVLAVPAARERLADVRLMAVVVSGLDEQPAGMGGAGLGDRSQRRLVSEVRSDGTIPRKPDSRLGRGKRPKRPTSAHSPAAERVSMPRKRRSRAIATAWPQAGICCSSAAISPPRRPSSSTAARRSTNVACEQATSNRC